MIDTRYLSVMVGAFFIASCALTSDLDASAGAQASGGAGEGEQCAGFVYECASGLDCISDGISLGTCERPSKRAGLIPLNFLSNPDEFSVSMTVQPNTLSVPVSVVPTLRSYIENVLVRYVVPVAQTQMLRIQELKPLLTNPDFHLSLAPKYAQIYTNKLKAKQALETLLAVGSTDGTNVQQCLTKWNGFDFYSPVVQENQRSGLLPCISMYNELLKQYRTLFANAPVISPHFLDRLSTALSLAESIAVDPEHYHLVFPDKTTRQTEFRTGTEQLLSQSERQRSERAILIAQAPFAVSALFERLVRDLTMVQILYPIVSMQVMVANGAGGGDILPLGEWAIAAMNETEPLRDGYPLPATERFRQGLISAWSATYQNNKELLEHIHAGWDEQEAWKLWPVAESMGFVNIFPQYKEIHNQLKTTIEKLSNDPTPTLWTVACVGSAIGAAVAGTIVSLAAVTASPTTYLALSAGVSVACLPASYYSAQWVLHLGQLIANSATMAFLGIEQGLIPPDHADQYEGTMSFATAMLGINVLFLATDIVSISKTVGASLKFLQGTARESTIGRAMPHSWRPPTEPLRASGEIRSPTFMFLENMFDKLLHGNATERFEVTTQLETVATASVRTATHTPPLNASALHAFISEKPFVQDGGSDMVLWLLGKSDDELRTIMDGVDSENIGAIRSIASTMSGYAKRLPGRVASALASDVSHLTVLQASVDEFVQKLELLISQIDALF